MADFLQEKLREQHLYLADGVVEKEIFFLEEMLRWNRKVNLTSITEPAEALEKHLYDSLLLLKYLPDSGRLLDMGSGAGFPGIPIALARPEISVTSVDSVGKKINFQKHIKRLLAVENLTPIQSRLEAICEAQPFEFVTARALSEIKQLVCWAEPVQRAGGRLLIMKGPGGKEELKTYLSEPGKGYRLDRVEHYILPLSGAVRQLISLVKI